MSSRLSRFVIPTEVEGSKNIATDKGPSTTLGMTFK